MNKQVILVVNVLAKAVKNEQYSVNEIEEVKKHLDEGFILKDFYQISSNEITVTMTFVLQEDSARENHGKPIR